MKVIKYTLLLVTFAWLSCSKEPTAERTVQDVSISVDMDDSDSRLAYDFANGSGLTSSGSIRAVWELGDILKVYETDENGSGAYTDVYHDYDAYNTANPYPAAPQTDVYYRFVCVGGEGTTRGVFRYVGLATATVEENPLTNIRNVNVDIKYNHAIHNWTTFQGLVIFGNPLRNYMMRKQNAPNDLTHLKFGERMYGTMCAHNFQWWYDRHNGTEGAGAERLVLKNVGGCIYRVIIGDIDTDIYGGSVVSLNIPEVTDQGGLRGEAMTLTLGNSDDFQLGNAPWARSDVENDAFCAYIVGWPGTMPANTTATVTLAEYVTGNTYTWELSTSEPIVFEEGPYYTIDLRGRDYTKTPQP